MVDEKRRLLIFVLIAGTLLGLLMIPPVEAQNPDAKEVRSKVVKTEKTPEPSAVIQKVSVQEILKISGWPMYVLAGASFVAATFVIYFFFVLRQEQIVPHDLHRELTSQTTSHTLSEMKRICGMQPSPLASVTVVALDYLQTVPDADAGLLRDMVQSEGARQAEAIQGQTRYLMDIAAITPMIGLLGTVLGMVKAFGAIAVDEAMARPLVLADGVRQALYTTAAGLVIAIPAMIFYAFFRQKAGALVSQLEVASAEILANVLRKRS